MDATLTAAAIGVGGTVIVGLAGFWANVRNTNKTASLTLRAVELTEQGQVTDRYTKAIEQLGSKELDVRIGGIYALERIARDSPRDHATILEVLAAFIREHSREHGALAAADVLWYSPLASGTHPDVQAALSVIGRRDTDQDRQPIDLSRAHIPAANLRGADLNAANLDRADLSGASLTGVDLRGATLPAANLT